MALPLLSAFFLIAAAAAPSPSPAPTTANPPAILVSRQLLASEHLAVGDVVTLSSDPMGARARPFRIAGVFEPVPDPSRLGAVPLEARLHLPDLLALTADPTDPLSLTAGTVLHNSKTPLTTQASSSDGERGSGASSGQG